MAVLLEIISAISRLREGILKIIMVAGCEVIDSLTLDRQAQIGCINCLYLLYAVEFDKLASPAKPGLPLRRTLEWLWARTERGKIRRRYRQTNIHTKAQLQAGRLTE